MGAETIYFDRRSVLKTAGATIGTALGVASTPASAQVGICVSLTESTEVWNDCPPSQVLGTVPRPARGRLLADCNFDYVYVTWDRPQFVDGWVDPSALTEC